MGVRAVAMATKFGQKNALITFLQEIEKKFAYKVGISGLVNFNTLSEFLRELRELLWQPNLGKNKLKLHRLHFCARNQGFFRTNSKVFFVGRRIQINIQNFKGAKGVAMATEFRKNKPQLH